MTEQPVETEQQFLGNAPRIAPRIVQPENTEVRELPESPALVALQHYAPGAHLRRPSWSPGDDVEVAALIRKCANAAKLAAIAKAEAVKAEEALHQALAVEEEAFTKLRAAEEALLAYTRKDTGL